MTKNERIKRSIFYSFFLSSLRIKAYLNFKTFFFKSDLLRKFCVKSVSWEKVALEF